NLTDAEEKLGKARLELDTFLAQYYAEAKIALAEEKLRATQVKLDELIAKSVTEEELATQRRKVELAQEQVEEAKEAVEAVAKKKLQVEQAEGNIEDAHLAIDDAEKALEDARTNLDRARGKSPLITAPFAGFVIKVNVEGGDEIKTGTVAMVIADPNKFEADILVSEMDILQIKLAGEAWVQVDARPEIKLPAKVTHISPTATIQQGVVNYTVKVELQSLEGTIQQRQPASDNLSSANITSGAPARGFRQPFGSGNLTQEQIEQMRQPSQQARAGQTRSQSVEMPTRIAENFQLREGLTITVSIIVDERQNVLLVPNQAITRQGQETYVQVEKEGITEKRSIRTGISNYQFTEVIEGLSEGEQVIVPQGTATTVPATQSGQRQGGIFVPGVGRIR
ncbi:MAG: HlyD family efflux transporter periplasmic adaptor subunit, partial [Chloroflexi bacterium]|nr:HlyD family efflux transporter periplasmic adaptor subunit [Chloroflexota bacterium]